MTREDMCSLWLSYNYDNIMSLESFIKYLNKMNIESYEDFIKFIVKGNNE